MLTIHGFVQVAPCMPRRFWREWPYLDRCTPRGRWIEQRTVERWERNYPENAAYAKTKTIEAEIGMVSNFRFICEPSAAVVTKADVNRAIDQFVTRQGYFVFCHPSYVYGDGDSK